MDLAIACPQMGFRWKDGTYRITKAGIIDDQPYAEVDPHDADLVDELKARISRDKGLRVYLGFGYCCFVEDIESEVHTWDYLDQRRKGACESTKAS